MASVVLRSVLCATSSSPGPRTRARSGSARGRGPYEFHVVGSGTPQVQGSAMCAEVVPNQIDLVVRAISRKQRVLEKA